MRMIGYVTSGYKSIEGSVEVARNFIRGGCDMLEISLPLINNREAPYLSDLMKQAITAYPDYDAHLEGIRQIRKEHPEISVTILLYNEVAVTIGAEKLAEFLDEAVLTGRISRAAYEKVCRGNALRLIQAARRFAASPRAQRRTCSSRTGKRSNKKPPLVRKGRWQSRRL